MTEQSGHDLNLSQYQCAWCGTCLSNIKKDGCGAVYPDSREACRRDGWERKLKEAARPDLKGRI